MTGMRIDKWLWAARFFKTRSLAAHACELGRVQCNQQAVKPARNIRSGDFLQIKTEGGNFEVEVLLLGEVRGSSAVAQTLYRETESSRELRVKMVAERRTGLSLNPAPQTRPSKRDRRKIIHFRNTGRAC